jgi:hypothetical protein
MFKKIMISQVINAWQMSVAIKQEQRLIFSRAESE